MRARHRHFNPGHAGASMALDSRFVSGLNDGDAVSTWSDRSGNANDAVGSGTSQPTFQTNEQNGQPIILFDGVNDHMFFDRGDITEGTCILFLRRISTSTYQSPFQVKQTSSNRSAIEVAVHSDFGSYGPILFGSNGNNTSYAKGGALRQGESRILSCQYLGGSPIGATNYRAWDDGKNITLSNSGAIGAATQNTDSIVGAVESVGSITAFFGGWIASITFIKQAIQSPLRRRIEHAAAFSFKIACS